MTWTLNASGHFDAPADEKGQRRDALIQSVRDAIAALTEKPSTAMLVWSDGEDQRNIDLLAEDTGA